jgi:4-hydroxybenzoate polyprenyltransferase
MLAFLRLTRPLNLLIIVITMAAMRYGVVGSWLSYMSATMKSVSDDPNGTLVAAIPHNDMKHAFSEVLFWLLVASTVLIAAAGNMINDYFDTRIDRVNKPDELIVGRSVKRRVAMAGHLIMSSAGFLLGAFVAWRSGQWRWMLIPAFAIGALWIYSTRLKRMFLVGNGLVSSLTALVPLTVGLYEITALSKTYPSMVTLTTLIGDEQTLSFDFNTPWFWILGYAAFAFLTTLVREIQKDLADVKGDEADGCRTLPIVWGTSWAKAIALLYLVLALAGVLFVRMRLLHDPLSYWYIGVAVLAPLLLSAGFTYNASTRREYTTAGNLMKVAMVVAIVYAFLLSRTLWDPTLLFPATN